MGKEEKYEANAAKEDYPELSEKERFSVSFSIVALARSHRALAAQLLREIGLFVGQELMLMQLWYQDHQSQQRALAARCGSTIPRWPNRYGGWRKPVLSPAGARLRTAVSRSYPLPRQAGIWRAR